MEAIALPSSAQPSAPTQNQASSMDISERPAIFSAWALTELTPTSKQPQASPKLSMKSISDKIPGANARQGRVISKAKPAYKLVRAPPWRAINQADTGKEPTATKPPHNKDSDKHEGGNCKCSHTAGIRDAQLVHTRPNL